jgi:hypothetical protein
MASVRERVEERRAELLRTIEVAARSTDTATVLSTSARLTELVGVLDSYRKLDERAELVLSGAPAPSAKGVPNEAPEEAEQVPGRGYGIDLRTKFLEKARAAGVDLRPYRGAIFRTPNGVRVGIAVATERKPNRWFLGLAEDGFDAAVLLCEDSTGRTLDICLPVSFVKRLKEKFSRSNGQVKFNVARRHPELVLKVPSVGAETIDQYVGAVSTLIA